MPFFSAKKFLSRWEQLELHDALGKYATVRDRLMLRMLSSYGMRASELLAMRKGDVDFESGTLVVHGLKGGLSRQFPILGSVMSDLSVICDGAETDESRIFPITYNRLGDVWRRFRPGGDKGKPLHSLRHTAAIKLYQDSKDIWLVKKYLGHRSIMSTMIYQDHSTDQEKFKAYLS